MDEKESSCFSSPDDESLTGDSEKVDVGLKVEVGDHVKVKNVRSRLLKVLDAQVLKINPDDAEKCYYVHYAGWIHRCDEWVKKSYVVANISAKMKDVNNLRNALLESARSIKGPPIPEESKFAFSFAGPVRKEPSPKPLHAESAFMSLMEGDKGSLESNKAFQSSPILHNDLNSPQNSKSASTTESEKKLEDLEQLEKALRREKKKSDEKGKGDEEGKKNRGDKDLSDKKTKRKRKLQLDEDTDGDPICKKCKKKKSKHRKVKEQASSSDKDGRKKLEPDRFLEFLEKELDLVKAEETSLSVGGPAERMLLDNTPPTTPSSTQSSSPPHPFAVEGFGGEERASGAEYIVATTLIELRKSPDVATAVSTSSVKQSKGPDPASAKRKKRMQLYVPDQHKTTYLRAANVDNYCEESSGTSCSPPYNSLNSPRPAAQTRFDEFRHKLCQENDSDKRIQMLVDELAEIRKIYMSLDAEVKAIDRKKRKARKKVRKAAGASANTGSSEAGPSCS